MIMLGDGDADEGLFEGLGGLQTMGILNALRTGNPTLDMLLAMCVPLLIQFIVTAFGRLDFLIRIETWQGWYNQRKRLHRRDITYKSQRDQWGGIQSDGDTENSILLKAIQLYLHSEIKMNLTEANLDLTSTEDANSSIGGLHYESDEEDTDRTIVGALSKYKIIKKPPIGKVNEIGYFGSPPMAVQLQIMHESNEVANDGGDQKTNPTSNRETKRFIFTSQRGYAIDDFIDRAYSWYMQELRDLEDDSRFFYELKDSGCKSRSSKDEESGSGDGPVYTRYRLSDEKTFDSLFFPEKESLLKLVDHFNRRTGKYAVKGYPHKLGVLLHGPPGSGKTSLIKSLAQYTGRSIVNVPLARISTNAELMSIFFDRKKQVDGEWVPVKLGFKDVIYVMEDVDAASKVVKRRVPLNDNATTTVDASSWGKAPDMPRPKSMWRMMLESGNDDCKELVSVLLKESDKLKQEALKPEVIKDVVKNTTNIYGLGLVGETQDDSILNDIAKDALETVTTLMEDSSKLDDFLGLQARRISRMIEAGAGVSDALVRELLSVESSPCFQLPAAGGLTERSICARESSEASACAAAEKSLIASMAQLFEADKADVPSIGPSLFKSKDQLNLTGLLNVLDGVVDSPGRIVIMTTNHVETLDPALIRPGRIDKKLLLGFMTPSDVVSMLEHYFQHSFSEAQKVRVELAMAGSLRFTPAQVEQLTAEYDDIESMINALESMNSGSS